MYSKIHHAQIHTRCVCLSLWVHSLTQYIPELLTLNLTIKTKSLSPKLTLIPPQNLIVTLTVKQSLKAQKVVKSGQIILTELNCPHNIGLKSKFVHKMIRIHTHAYTKTQFQCLSDFIFHVTKQRS